MSKRECISGVLEEAEVGRWRIGAFVLMSGAFMELFIEGKWILGCLDYCGGKVCSLMSWDDQIPIKLRPGLKVRAVHFNHG